MKDIQAPKVQVEPYSPVRLNPGTIVFTMDGALPVEFLTAGDRIITRAGMRVLRKIAMRECRGFSLAFDRAEEIFADGQIVRT